MSNADTEGTAKGAKNFVWKEFLLEMHVSNFCWTFKQPPCTTSQGLLVLCKNNQLNFYFNILLSFEVCRKSTGTATRENWRVTVTTKGKNPEFSGLRNGMGTVCQDESKFLRIGTKIPFLKAVLKSSGSEKEVG